MFDSIKITIADLKQVLSFVVLLNFKSYVMKTIIVVVLAIQILALAYGVYLLLSWDLQWGLLIAALAASFIPLNIDNLININKP